MNIAIIGAGPVGCYAGALLAESGHSVSIYEKKSKIGKPVQCTGILTSDFDKLNISIEPFLVNTINSIEIISPNGYVRFKQKDYVICREKFDNHLANLALRKGVKIFMNHYLLRKNGESLILRDTITDKEEIISPDIVIAADGPLSPTAKAFDFYEHGRENYYGLQAVVEGNFNRDAYQTFFGREVCPDLFAWIVPESPTIARIGLASKRGQKELFDRFIKEHVHKRNFTVREIQAGVIPLFCPKQRLKKDNCYLVGDASSYVKATTLGGIVPGLRQAKVLAECINNGKDYEKEIRHLRREMKLHLYLHRTLCRFSDDDLDRLLQMFSRQKMQEVMSSCTRDEPFTLLFRALLAEPRLLLFMKHIF